jgi:hypothetical protein
MWLNLRHDIWSPLSSGNHVRDMNDAILNFDWRIRHQFVVRGWPGQVVVHQQEGGK